MDELKPSHASSFGLTLGLTSPLPLSGLGARGSLEVEYDAEVDPARVVDGRRLPEELRRQQAAVAGVVVVVREVLGLEPERDAIARLVARELIHGDVAVDVGHLDARRQRADAPADRDRIGELSVQP